MGVRMSGLGWWAGVILFVNNIFLPWLILLLVTHSGWSDSFHELLCNPGRGNSWVVVEVLLE